MKPSTKAYKLIPGGMVQFYQGVLKREGADPPNAQGFQCDHRHWRKASALQCAQDELIRRWKEKQKP